LQVLLSKVGWLVGWLVETGFVSQNVILLNSEPRSLLITNEDEY